MKQCFLNNETMFPVCQAEYTFISRLSGASQAGDNWLSQACEAADNRLSLAVACFLSQEQSFSVLDTKT